jgi:NADPH:quinone reductase-like Zn-dependent oxidoreductase
MSTIAEFNDVMALVVAGKLRPVIDRTFPLQEAAAAQERLEHGEQFGKITLAIP